MSFPDDLSGVVAFKIHPAVGVARLSRGRATFTLGEAVTRYKANRLMKRQCVQFRIFAYGRDNQGLGELTAEVMTALGIQAVWRVTVANRKIARLRRDDAYEIQATASSDVGGGVLTGQLAAFAQGSSIPLGQISATGLFTPPLSGVFYEQEDGEHPDELHVDSIADNTGDGPVTVELRQNNRALRAPVLGAWVVIAPQDFAPDAEDQMRTLAWYLQRELGTPGNPVTNPVNQTARYLDREVLRRCTGKFSPGIETSFASAGEILEVRSAFLPAAQTGDPDEIRVALRGADPNVGVRPGMLSSGLCSPWQNDFLACTCYWWPAQRPDAAYHDESSQTQVDWLRKRYDDTNIPAPSQLANPVELIAHVDELGVIRRIDGRPVETERTGDIT